MIKGEGLVAALHLEVYNELTYESFAENRGRKGFRKTLVFAGDVFTSS